MDYEVLIGKTDKKKKKSKLKSEAKAQVTQQMKDISSVSRASSVVHAFLNGNGIKLY